MKIEAKVIPNAKRVLVKPEGPGLKVYLTAPPLDGRANDMLSEVLAAHLGVKKRQLTVIKGLHSRQKTIKIDKL